MQHAISVFLQQGIDIWQYKDDELGRLGFSASVLKIGSECSNSCTMLIACTPSHFPPPGRLSHIPFSIPPKYHSTSLILFPNFPPIITSLCTLLDTVLAVDPKSWSQNQTIAPTALTLYQLSDTKATMCLLTGRARHIELISLFLLLIFLVMIVMIIFALLRQLQLHTVITASSHPIQRLCQNWHCYVLLRSFSL